MCCPDLNPIPLGSRDKHANHRIPSQLSVSLWWPPQSKWTLGGNGTPKSWCWSKSENSHYRGKDHCMAGFQFNWIAFDQTRKYVDICRHGNYWIQASQTGQRLYSDTCPYYRECSLCSVTRFGEILPLWQKFTSLWQIFDRSFLIWQNTELTFQICDYWASLTPLQKLPKNVGDLGKAIVAKDFEKLPKVKKNRPIWSHCLRLTNVRTSECR